MALKRLASSSSLLVVLAASRAAVADEAKPSRAPEESRPHTMAVLEAGIIALPNAPISSSQRGGATPFGTIGRGDATVMTGIRLLYRGGTDWAIGAGALFGPNPTSDTEYGGLKGLRRSHSRSYLSLGTEGRYVPLRYRAIEGWVGVTAGFVIIADRFTTSAGPDVPPVLGVKETTIRTEGFSVGVQAGASWSFAEHWAAGLTARANRWILPSEPACAPIGDCGTLKGTVEAFEVGLTLGYRIPL
ncbi:MAG: hypothetical protein JNL38_09290 [Myxococcales bacterium]|jgi:opacity protein-like surface antigen|nr:hypothetical protein [Myxococcales bacterium]